jgi:hypothetical protein
MKPTAPSYVILMVGLRVGATDAVVTFLLNEREDRMEGSEVPFAVNAPRFACHAILTSKGGHQQLGVATFTRR